MTPDKRARLEEIKDATWYYLTKQIPASHDNDKLQDTFSWLIEELQTAWSMEARLVEALEKCARPNTWHAPCLHCGEKIIEAGSYIAREALATNREAMK